MIKLQVIYEEEQHFVLSGDEPMRVEVSVFHGKIVAHVYRGVKVDGRQEPVGMYDGTIKRNSDWLTQ